MRISDWSSDVCSSDLPARADGKPAIARILELLDADCERVVRGARCHGIDRAAKRLGAARAIIFDLGDGAIWQAQRDRGGDARGPDVHRVEADRLPGGIDLRGFDASRSEEHTSELQS